MKGVRLPAMEKVEIWLPDWDDGRATCMAPRRTDHGSRLPISLGRPTESYLPHWWNLWSNNSFWHKLQSSALTKSSCTFALYTRQQLDDQVRGFLHTHQTFSDQRASGWHSFASSNTNWMSYRVIRYMSFRILVTMFAENLYSWWSKDTARSTLPPRPPMMRTLVSWRLLPCWVRDLDTYRDRLNSGQNRCGSRQPARMAACHRIWLAVSVGGWMRQRVRMLLSSPSRFQAAFRCHNSFIKRS